MRVQGPKSRVQGRRSASSPIPNSGALQRAGEDDRRPVVEMNGVIPSYFSGGIVQLQPPRAAKGVGQRQTSRSDVSRLFKRRQRLQLVQIASSTLRRSIATRKKNQVPITATTSKASISGCNVP